MKSIQRASVRLLAVLSLASCATAPKHAPVEPELLPVAIIPTPPPPIPTMMPTEATLARLQAYVQKQSHPDALRFAVTAYANFKAKHPELVRKPYLYFVDFGLSSGEPRGFIFDMDALTLIAGPFAVAHGRGSTNQMTGIPTRFSNTPGSNMTSLGLYLTQETYRFSGHSGGTAYSSIGLRVNGVSTGFNTAARMRGVVVHGAPYVTREKAGRSEGCPAMEMELAQRLIPQIAQGALIFLFSPNDADWMQGDPWVHAARL
jgi:hypothetical protein